MKYFYSGNIGQHYIYQAIKINITSEGANGQHMPLSVLFKKDTNYLYSIPAKKPHPESSHEEMSWQTQIKGQYIT